MAKAGARSGSTHLKRQERAQRVNRFLAGCAGGSLGLIGGDHTAEVARRPSLVLAPHPDDETLGCAATMMRKIEAGTLVSVVMATSGGKWPPNQTIEQNSLAREAELAHATGVIGLDPKRLSLLRLEDGGLATSQEALIDAISDSVRSNDYQDVLCTATTDPHEDHAALGRAAVAALAGTKTRLLFYPVWQWEHPRAWLRLLRSSGRPELVDTAGYLDRKRSAIAHYGSQLANSSNSGLEEGFLAHFLTKREVFFPYRKLA